MYRSWQILDMFMIELLFLLLVLLNIFFHVLSSSSATLRPHPYVTRAAVNTAELYRSWQILDLFMFELLFLLLVIIKSDKTVCRCVEAEWNKSAGRMDPIVIIFI